MKIVNIFFVLCAISVSQAISVQIQEESFLKGSFEEFKSKFNKKYETEEEELKRFEIFKSSMNTAAELELKNGGSATFGVTKFSDLTKEEFRRIHLIPNFGKMADSQSRANLIEDPTPSTPSISCKPDPVNYDWNSCGVITPVKNEGQCGSCWAFVVIEEIESYCAIQGTPLTPLSVQEVVSCVNSGQGCNGGFPQWAYDYVIAENGIETESEYPYTAEEDVNCTANKQESICSIKGYANITGGEEGLYKQVSSPNGGPVAVCVDADEWQTYTGGILTQCGNNINFCAQLTGYANYGETAGSYWIVRNEWGTDWGIDGYIYIETGQDLCAIADYATYPVV